MVNSTDDPRYQEARKYIADYLVRENPRLQKKFPGLDASILLCTLDDETLLDLEAGRIPTSKVYSVLEQNKPLLIQPIIHDYSEVDNAPLPQNPRIQEEVDRISHQIKHNRSSRTFRDSNVSTDQGGKNWNGISLLRR